MPDVDHIRNMRRLTIASGMTNPPHHFTSQSASAQQNGRSAITEGTVLAFDFGKKRIGVAVGNTALKLAHPLTTLHSEKNDQRFAAIHALIQEWQPVLLVVGLPCHSDGTAHEMTHLCQRFARRLTGRFSIQTLLVDERYTSRTASTALHQAGVSGRKQKPFLDQVAAQHILQSFFDEHHAYPVTA